MFRLKILWRGLDLGNSKSISERKRFPIFVSAFLPYGGLYLTVGFLVCKIDMIGMIALDKSRYKYNLKQGIRNFARTPAKSSLNYTKFRGDLCEISGKENLADTVYGANRLNLMCMCVCVCITLSRLVNENWLSELHVDWSVVGFRTYLHFSEKCGFKYMVISQRFLYLQENK